MDAGICELIGLSILLGPPFLLCWTAAVLIVRSLYDRPITLHVAWEAFTAGLLLASLWSFPPWLIGLLTGAVVFLPSLWANTTGRLELPAIAPALAAAGVAIAVYWWKGFWPIAVAEWRRVTCDEVRRG